MTRGGLSAHLALGRLGTLHRWHQAQSGAGPPAPVLPAAASGGGSGVRADVHGARPREKFLSPTHRGGAQARPNHCPRGEGRPYQYHSPNASADFYPGGSPLLPGRLPLPAILVATPKRPVLSFLPRLSCAAPPVSLGAVPCRGSRGGGARPAPSPGGVSRRVCPRSSERSCGWDHAGPESRNLSPPNRGCYLCVGAAGAAGE